jgi:DNA-directed RNA polymerase specialized sigma24 family protein
MTIKIRELPPVLQAVFNLSVIDRYPQIAIAKMNGIRLEAAEAYIQVTRQQIVDRDLR